MNRSFASILAGAALACAALAAPAAAQNVVYIGADDNVYLSTPDGARKHQVTTDARDGKRYRTPSEADDGRIVVPASDNFVWILRPDGSSITGPWLAPRRDSLSTSPTSAHVTPQGGLIVFDQIHSDGPPNFNIRPRVRVMNGDAPTSDPNCTAFPCQDHYTEPRWVPGTPAYGAISAGGDYIHVGTAQGGFPQWLHGGGADIETFDVSRTGNLALIQVQADGAAATAPGELVLWQNVGAPPAAETGSRQLCRVPNFGNGNSDPRWSADGTMFAWEDAQGVWVSPAPRDLQHNVGTDTCGITPSLIAPGGKDPAFGPAAVPGGTTDPGGSDPGTPPPGTNPGDGSTPGGSTPGGSTPGGSTPDGSGAADGSAPVASVSLRRPPRLRSALSSGLPSTVRCDEACSISVELLGPGPSRRVRGATLVTASANTALLGRGSARLTAAGSRRVVARFSRSARSRYRRGRSLKLTVQVTVRDAAGNRRVLSRRVTLRR